MRTSWIDPDQASYLQAMAERKIAPTGGPRLYYSSDDIAGSTRPKVGKGFVYRRARGRVIGAPHVREARDRKQCAKDHRLLSSAAAELRAKAEL